jgi:quercetin dioxygenase-like cupin family protein
VLGEDPCCYLEAPGPQSLAVPAGVARFAVVTFGPGYRSTIHSTESIDFNTCLTGELDLTLESGTVRLGPGDLVIVPGARHAWHTAAGGSFSFVVVSLFSPGRSESGH